jgi:hypothetical protein
MAVATGATVPIAETAKTHGFRQERGSPSYTGFAGHVNPRAMIGYRGEKGAKGGWVMTARPSNFLTHGTGNCGGVKPGCAKTENPYHSIAWRAFPAPLFFGDPASPVYSVSVTATLFSHKA